MSPTGQDGAMFVSPLLATPGPLSTVDFGTPPRDPAIDALAARMDAAVMALAQALPQDLRPEAEAALRGYGGGTRLFIELFYRPVWSFLHWLPAPGSATGEAVLAVACRVQAMALFLHLWDDHLSDGQLAPDLVRLHLRSLAWQSFSGGVDQLCRAAGLQPDAAEAMVTAYLSSVHRPGPANSLDAHAERMVRQVGIWRVVPLAYGQVVGGTAAAAALCQVVERFSVAWRLIDDVQDAAEDAARGQQNALDLALDPAGRAAWARCRNAAPDVRHAAWAIVEAAIADGGLARVVARAQRELTTAEEAAQAQGWAGLAAELSACRIIGDPAG